MTQFIIAYKVEEETKLIVDKKSISGIKTGRGQTSPRRRIVRLTYFFWEIILFFKSILLNRNYLSY